MLNIFSIIQKIMQDIFINIVLKNFVSKFLKFDKYYQLYNFEKL